MSKSKNPAYVAERLKRTKVRKGNRKAKRKSKKEMYKKLNGVCTCGEVPYCYCGSGTPGVIDY